MEETKYSDDPLVNQTLTNIERVAAAYRAEHKDQTDTESEDFIAWKNNVPDITDAESDEIPDAETLAAFIWDEANPAQLLALVEVIDEMRDSLNRRIRMAYNGKGGDDDSDTPDLATLRERLVNALNGVLANIESGVLAPLTEEQVYNLPSVKPRKERTNKDGTIGFVWDFPKAPKTPSVKKSNNGARNLRKNNTTVKLLVNGAIPSDYPASGELGDAIAKYLGNQDNGKPHTVQSVAARFDQYRNVERADLWTGEDSTVYGLTSKPYEAKK